MMILIRGLSLGLAIGTVFISNAVIVQAETAATDHQHGHAQEEHDASVLRLDHGNKWQTDAPLRQGMQRINDAVTQAVPAYHDDALTKSEADTLARQINEQVAYLVANCKLEPDADATLHVLIGQLLAGVANLEKDPLSPQGLPYMVNTLHQYMEYFDQPVLNKKTEK